MKGGTGMTGAAGPNTTLRASKYKKARPVHGSIFWMVSRNLVANGTGSWAGSVSVQTNNATMPNAVMPGSLLSMESEKQMAPSIFHFHENAGSSPDLRKQ